MNDVLEREECDSHYKVRSFIVPASLCSIGRYADALWRWVLMMSDCNRTENMWIPRRPRNGHGKATPFGANANSNTAISSSASTTTRTLTTCILI